MNKILMTSVAAFALCAGPYALGSMERLDQASLITMAAASNGNGNGHNNGNAGGNSGGNSGGKSDTANSGGGSATSNAGSGSSNSGDTNSGNKNSAERGNSAASRKQPDTVNSIKSTTMSEADHEIDTVADAHSNDTHLSESVLSSDKAKDKSLHAVLNRINSIQRNMNALINSKDPKLASLRTYILNSAELTKAQTSADAAQAALDAAITDYANAGLTGDYTSTLASLATAAASADASSLSAIYAQIDIVNAVIAAQNNLVASEARVAQFSVLTSDAAFTDALASLSNRQLSSADITPEALAWAKATLGTDDAAGAIDSAMAQLP